MKRNLLYATLAVCAAATALSFKLHRPAVADKQLKNLTNVVYGANTDTIGEKEPMTMDIFFPKGATAGKKYPLAFMVHGGGFIKGTKETMNKNCQMMADSGFVSISLSYRMGWNARESRDPKATNTQMAASYRAFQDANAAMRFLISKAKDYAIDTSRIFVGGASAGAVTVLALTYLSDDFAQKRSPEYVKLLGGLHNSGNDLKNKYSVKGVCSMWGALPDSTLVNRETAVPTIFFHGTEDKVVPVDKGHGAIKGAEAYGTLCLYRQNRALGVPAIAHIMPGAGHGPDEYQKDFFAIRNTICFFKSVLKGNAHSGLYYKLDGSCGK